MLPTNVVAAASEKLQIEHTLGAVTAGVTVGYQDADGTPGTDGTFVPVNSAGLKVTRMTMGGGVPTFVFGFEGNNVPDTDASWRQIRITGTTESGTFTTTFTRSAANSYEPTNPVNETQWGFGPLSDRFINGNSYQVFIDDRIG